MKCDKCGKEVPYPKKAYIFQGIVYCESCCKRERSGMICYDCGNNIPYNDFSYDIDGKEYCGPCFTKLTSRTESSNISPPHEQYKTNDDTLKPYADTDHNNKQIIKGGAKKRFILGGETKLIVFIISIVLIPLFILAPLGGYFIGSFSNPPDNGLCDVCKEPASYVLERVNMSNNLTSGVILHEFCDIHAALYGIFNPVTAIEEPSLRPYLLLGIMIWLLITIVAYILITSLLKKLRL